jgi:hypothetical protein
MASKYDRMVPLTTPRPTCPVCHHPVYASNGIHPQCALRQSEPPRPKPAPALPAVVAVAGTEVAAPAVARPASRWGGRRI